METMKMKWGNPLVEVQQFNAQEFCATCEKGWVKVDNEPTGEYKYGWQIRDVSGNTTSLLQVGSWKTGEDGTQHYLTGYLLEAPNVPNITIGDLLTYSNGVWTANYSGYSMASDTYQYGVINSGDEIGWNGCNFKLTGGGYSEFATPHSDYFTYQPINHS